MLKDKKLIICFSFIISLFFSFQTLAAERYEEENYNPSRLPIDTSLQSVTSSSASHLDDPEAVKKKTIETALSPTVLTLGNIPENGVKAGAGLAAAGGSVLSTQALIASEMETLFQLGALNNVPSDGAPSLLIATTVGLIPVAVGGMACYEATLDTLKTPTPEVLAAQFTTNERPKSMLEKLTYCVPTKMTQFLFIGGMMALYYLNLEHRVDGWGNIKFGEVFSTWGIVMGVAALFVIYAVICRATSNPNSNPYLFNRTSRERKDQEKLLSPGKATVHVIQDKGLTREVQAVAQAFNLEVIGNSNTNKSIQDETSEEERQPILRTKPEELEEGSASGTFTRDTREDLQDEGVSKYRYEMVLKKEKRAQQTLSLFQDYWDRGADWGAYIFAPVLQAPSLFIKPMLANAFFNQFSAYCGAPYWWAFGIGIGATVLSYPFLFGTSVKELPLTHTELKQFFRLYKSQISCGSESSGLSYIGSSIYDRVAPLTARGAAFLCIPVTLATFLKTHVLVNTYGITDPVTQNIIIAAFFAGTVWPATAQTFDKYVTRIRNWLEMGAPVTYPWCCTCNFKLFPCVDKEGTKYMLFALQNRIKYEHVPTLESFNPEYTTLALGAITRPIIEEAI